MVTTPSTLLRTARQGRNDNIGTWDTVIHGVLDRIEEAITGTTTVAITGGTYTLTKNDLLADEGRSAVVRATGALTSNGIIVLPYSGKPYTLSNECTGAFTLTFQTSTGQTIVIPQGYLQMVYIGSGGNMFAVGPAMSKTLGINPLAYGTARIPKSALATDVQAILDISATGVGQTISLPSGQSLNAVVTSGFYRLDVIGAATDWPSSSANYSQMIVSRGIDTITQIVTSLDGASMWYRTGSGIGGGSPAWSTWKSLWNSGNFNPASYLALAGGVMTGDLGLKGFGTTNAFQNGTADGATYANYNFKLKGWNGMGMAGNDDVIRGVFDFRNGTWDTLGGYKLNGTAVVAANGDILAKRGSAPTTGVVAFGAGSAFISYDGTNFSFSGGQLFATTVNATASVVTPGLSSTSRSLFQGSQSSGGIATATGGLGGAEIQGGGGSNAAFLSFHRPANFAAYFGLDTDNKWKVGGWSMGAVAYELYHQGNFPAGLVPKAILNYNLATQTITRSVGVSSVTYTSTGIFTVNFSTAFADTSYSAVGWARDNVNTNGNYLTAGNADTKTTTAMGFKVYNNGSGLQNPTEVCIVFFG